MKQTSSAWFAPASLAAIIGLSLGPLIIVARLDPVGSSDQTTGALLLAALAVVALADLLLVRFVLLPTLVTHPESTQENATVVGYSIALAPAIFGVAASVYTGQALLALPFGAFALVSWAIVRRLLQDSYPDDRRPSLGEHRP